MSFARVLSLSLASVPFLAAVVRAQTLEVPGDHDTIQAALDAAPEGATVVVHGGTWDTITISRSVNLIGAPPPQLESGDFGRFAPIILDGAGTGEVTLSGIRTGALIPDGPAPTTLSPAIEGGGFDELHIYDCEILAPERAFFSGLGYGNSAIVTDVPYVVVERSTVRGSRTDIDDACTGNPSGWIPPPGIQASGTVVVLDSHVVGGRMGFFQYSGWPTPADCDPGNCPDFPGAIGISCSTLYHSESVIEGGEGAHWNTCFPSAPCCQSPPGEPLAVSQEHPLPNVLWADDPPVIGQEYVLHLVAPGPTATLYVAPELDPPVIVTGVGPRFTPAGSTISLGPVTTPGDFAIPIPLSATLLGRTVAFQLIDPTLGYSRPLAGTLQASRAATGPAPSDAFRR